MLTFLWPISATHNSVTSVGNTAGCAVSDVVADDCGVGHSEDAILVARSSFHVFLKGYCDWLHLYVCVSWTGYECVCE